MKTSKKYAIDDNNLQLLKSLQDKYIDLYHKIEAYVFKHQKDNLKANIILSKIIKELIKHQTEINDVNKFSNLTIKNYVSKIEKSINYQKTIATKKQNDCQVYTIAGLWITMCGYIVTMFIKEFLTDHYLIHISIDFLVAVAAFYVTLHQIKRQYQIIKRYSLNWLPFCLTIIGLMISIVVIILTYTSYFDITFIIMVVAYLTSQKMIKKELL